MSGLAFAVAASLANNVFQSKGMCGRCPDSELTMDFIGVFRIRHARTLTPKTSHTSYRVNDIRKILARSSTLSWALPLLEGPSNLSGFHVLPMYSLFAVGGL